MLTQKYGSAPTLRAYATNSSVPKRIRFFRLPGCVPSARARILGADAVLPVVAGRKIAAGPAQERNVQVARGFEHVFAEAVAIGERRAFVVDATIDAAAEMLGEIAVDFAVDGANLAVEVEFDARGGRRCRRCLLRGARLGPCWSGRGNERVSGAESGGNAGF